MENGKKNFFWLDLEMTGLDEKVDSILEVAVIITDTDFNILEQFESVIYQTSEVLENMNDFCKNLHGKSGLTQKVPFGKPLNEIEDHLLKLIEKYFRPQDQVVLCGNSIGNDRRFIKQYMPRLENKLHYRLIDVSSFKEIFREKYNIHFQKTNKHRALDDVQESIQEMKHYLSFFKFKK